MDSEKIHPSVEPELALSNNASTPTTEIPVSTSNAVLLEQYADSMKNSAISEKVNDCLSSYGFEPDEVETLKLGYDTVTGNIIKPLADGFIMLSTDKSSIYADSRTFHEKDALLVSHSNEKANAVITASVIDAMKAELSGFRVVLVNGEAIEAEKTADQAMAFINEKNDVAVIWNELPSTQMVFHKICKALNRANLRYSFSKSDFSRQKVSDVKSFLKKLFKKAEDHATLRCVPYATLSDEQYIEFCKDSLTDIDDCDSINSFITKNNLKTNVMLQYNIGFDHKREIIVFPCDNGYASFDINDFSIFPKFGDKIPDSFGLFNASVLQMLAPVFVTGNPMAALSYESIGFSSVALNSKINADRLVERLISHEIVCPIIIAMNDSAEEIKVADEMCRKLDDNGYAYKRIYLPSRYNTTFHMLSKNKDSFQKKVETAANKVMIYSKNKNYLNSSFESIKKADVFANNFTSGFSLFDSKLDHFYPGLHIISAQPGMGKTALMMNIVHNMCRKGINVIYFSTELSEQELTARGITMTAYEKFGDEAPTVLQVGSTVEDKCYDSAKSHYAEEIAGNLTIIDRAVSSKDIGDIVKGYCEEYSQKPFVVIDYLQRIKNPTSTVNGSQISDPKEANSITSDELSALCKELSIPILCVSSMARSKYTSKPTLDCIKESGNYEYDSVTVFALVYTATMVDKLTESQMIDVTRTERAKDVKEITLCNVKNRNGETGFEINFQFLGKHGIFIEKD